MGLTENRKNANFASFSPLSRLNRAFLHGYVSGCIFVSFLGAIVRGGAYDCRPKRAVKHEESDLAQEKVQKVSSES